MNKNVCISDIIKVNMNYVHCNFASNWAKFKIILEVVTYKLWGEVCNINSDTMRGLQRHVMSQETFNKWDEQA